MRHERELSRRRDEPRARAPEPAPEHALLALQRTAGNRAVGAMLARDITPTTEPMDAQPEAGPSGVIVVVPGIGAIPIESYNLAGRSRTPSPSGRGKEEPPKKDKDTKDDELPGGEVGFTSIQGEHSSALFRWSLDGKPKDIVIVASQGTSSMRITLKGALIASMNVSSEDPPSEHWTVDCRAMKVEIIQPGG